MGGAEPPHADLQRCTSDEVALHDPWRATLSAMKAQIVEELIDLSPAEKRELAEALIASADSESSAPAVSEAQRAELRARLAHHRAHPNEPGITFQELKAKLLASAA